MIVGFNLIMLMLLELPLLAYTFAPDWTPRRWTGSRHGSIATARVSASGWPRESGPC